MILQPSGEMGSNRFKILDEDLDVKGDYVSIPIINATNDDYETAMDKAVSIGDLVAGDGKIMAFWGSESSGIDLESINLTLDPDTDEFSIEITDKANTVTDTNISLVLLDKKNNKLGILSLGLTSDSDSTDVTIDFNGIIFPPGGPILD
jgi:hypothetical protein